LPDAPTVFALFPADIENLKSSENSVLWHVCNSTTNKGPTSTRDPDRTGTAGKPPTNTTDGSGRSRTDRSLINRTSTDRTGTADPDQTSKTDRDRSGTEGGVATVA
jgi:hypothetical protein